MKKYIGLYQIPNHQKFSTRFNIQFVEEIFSGMPCPLCSNKDIVLIHGEVTIDICKVTAIYICKKCKRVIT